MPRAPRSTTSSTLPSAVAASSSSSASKLTPETYRALKTEQGVFTTPPYSGELKGLWKFKDADTARESSSALWTQFQAYKEKDDFVGSLRYALRKGGRKYEHPITDSKEKGKRNRSADEDEHDAAGSGSRAAGRKEIPRTGEVYDESKLEGANVFEGYLDRCWADEVYANAWEDWREAGKRKDGKKATGTKRTTGTNKKRQ